MRCWPPSCTSRARDRDSCCAHGCWSTCRREWGSRWSWSVPRRASARPACWPTGPDATAGRSPGCRWTRATTTRRGSGATWSPRWRGGARGWPGGWARCLARRHSRPSRGGGRARRGGGGLGVAGGGPPLLGPPTPPSFEGLVTALINELAAQPEEVLLVLDDYHLIEAEPVHASLGFLLEHRPACLRLWGAGRGGPGRRRAGVPARAPAALPGAVGARRARSAAAAGQVAGRRAAGRAARARP